MSQNVIYGKYTTFNRTISILTCREHLCSYYETLIECAEAGTRVDPDTGHTVCLACEKITWKSGLRECDSCEREFIDKTKYHDPNYEVICPECREEFGISDDF